MSKIVSIFSSSFNKFLEEKDQNMHLNDTFPLKIAKISLQKLNFLGVRLPNSTFCMCMVFYSTLHYHPHPHLKMNLQLNLGAFCCLMPVNTNTIKMVRFICGFIDLNANIFITVILINIHVSSLAVNCQW